MNALPEIDANGLMHINGFFPSVPMQVTFDLSYAPVNGQWQLMGLSVNVRQAAPAAPAAPPPPDVKGVHAKPQ